MDIISFNDFKKIEIRVGKVIKVDKFPEAHKPALKLRIDFGDAIGIKKSSAQITHHYNLENLLGKNVLAVVNFEPRQIGKFMSEVLVLGISDCNGNIVLIKPDNEVPLGAKLH